MVKLLGFVALVAVGLGLWSGAIEVRWHQEAVAGLPTKVASLAQDAPIYEQGRGQAVAWQRQGEQYITHDSKQRLQLAISYVQADSKRLDELLGEKHAASYLVPQAKLLGESVRLLQGTIAKASNEDLIAIKDESIKTTAGALAAVTKLQTKELESKENQDALGGPTDILATLLGRGTVGKVAGAEDTPTSSPTVTSTPKSSPNPSKIPLRF